MRNRTVRFLIGFTVVGFACSLSAIEAAASVEKRPLFGKYERAFNKLPDKKTNGLPAPKRIARSGSVKWLARSWRILYRRTHRPPPAPALLPGRARLNADQQHVAKIIVDEYRAHGLAPAGGIAVAIRESSLVSRAIGDGGCAYGPFQIQWCSKSGSFRLEVQAHGLKPRWNTRVAARNTRVCTGLNPRSAASVAYVQTVCFERPSNKYAKARIDVSRVPHAQKIADWVDAMRRY